MKKITFLSFIFTLISFSFISAQEFSEEKSWFQNAVDAYNTGKKIYEYSTKAMEIYDKGSKSYNDDRFAWNFSLFVIKSKGEHKFRKASSELLKKKFNGITYNYHTINCLCDKSKLYYVVQFSTDSYAIFDDIYFGNTKVFKNENYRGTKITSNDVLSILQNHCQSECYF